MKRPPDARPEDVQLVSIGLVSRWPGNPRRGEVNVLRTMYKSFGQRKPIIVQRSSDRIVAGNHWHEAMEAEGASQILVVYADVDDLTAERLAIADNQSHERGQYDDDDLTAWLRRLYEQNALDASLGYTAAQLDSFLKTFSGHGRSKDPDALPEPSIAPWVKPGMLIALGDHRLVCGDARDEAVWSRLFDGGEDALVTAAMVLTDPPYGAAYIGRPGRDHRRPIAHDADPSTAIKVTAIVLGHALARLDAGRALYVHAHAGAPLARALDLAVEQGWYRQTISWTKDEFVVGRSDFQYQWEPILYGWKTGQSHIFYGDRRQSTVWAFDRPKDSDLSSTQKPVALCEHAITLSTQEGELVVDPFAGSGSTLIAAERTGRICHAIELEPAMVQVIVERFETVTGMTHAVIEQADAA